MCYGHSRNVSQSVVLHEPSGYKISEYETAGRDSPGFTHLTFMVFTEGNKHRHILIVARGKRSPNYSCIQYSHITTLFTHLRSYICHKQFYALLKEWQYLADSVPGKNDKYLFIYFRRGGGLPQCSWYSLSLSWSLPLLAFFFFQINISTLGLPTQFLWGSMMPCILPCFSLLPLSKHSIWALKIWWNIEIWTRLGKSLTGLRLQYWMQSVKIKSQARSDFKHIYKKTFLWQV